MANAVLSETRLGVIEAAKMCPGRGSRPTHWQTVKRWIKRGRRVNGVTVRLEAAHVGTKIVTSAEAIDRFFSRITAAAGFEQESCRVPSPAERARAYRQTEAELKRLGVL